MTLGIIKKKMIKELIESKPSREQIFNSVIINKSYFEESCKQQIKLSKKQENERNKLKPTYELNKMKFDI